MFWSLTLMYMFLPFLMICLSRTGSSMGSTSFSTFSMTRHRPSPMVNSIWSFKFLAVKVVMHMPGFWAMRFASRRLIHRLAWPCGSTIKGYLDDRVTMMAFWMDRSSAGKPSSAHSPMVPLSTRKLTCSTFWWPGTWRLCVSARKSLNKRSRNSALNGPQYTTKAQTDATSPTSLLRRRAKFFESSVHRAFSPERPDRSLFAASALSCNAWALSCNSFMVFMAFASSASSSATSAMTLASSASAAASWAMALLSAASASFKAANFGCTIFAAPWYWHIAATKRHRPLAAPLAFSAMVDSHTLCSQGPQCLAGSSSWRK
mmetsp:Transcript_1338/g.3857  ORF Transcript_1338/g.3857 Transcript_1338/m.3857 type:complete len:318 (-) Transcript_1338:4170-5123(-)